jgi:predicted alpha/beta superfamily hydrolase
MKFKNQFNTRSFGITATLILAFSTTGVTQQASQSTQTTITLKLISPDLADTTKVFIAGNRQELGNWNPAVERMGNVGNHTWIKQIKTATPASIEYKFTLGSWDRQAADANGNEYHNFEIMAKRDTTISHNIYFWTNPQQKKIIESKVTGNVWYHRQLSGSGILPRDIVVWLPPDYSSEKTKHYPVVYMHDGQNIFDRATSSFGVDWQIDESADSLIKNNITESFIVVGIYNTSNRTSEYTPGKEGTEYMKFVTKKLKPFIDSAYRTKPDRKNTIVGGSSAGGIISFMLVWEYPQVFSKAICMSPAFKIENIDYVKTVIASKPRKNVFFYIDNGGIGLETKLQPGVDEMLAALKQKGYKQGKNYNYVVDPNAKHVESDWAKRFPLAIKWCLGIQ